MKIYKNQTFKQLDIDSNQTLQNLYFEKCEFHNVILSYHKNEIPHSRSKLMNCVFKNCIMSGRGCSQNKIYLKNVLFENIKIPNHILITRGVIFNQVTFKGKFDKVLLNSNHDGALYVNPEGYIEDYNEEQVKLLNDYANNEYNKMEWAIDISKAEFKECDLRSSIPAHLIKRDPETQILLKYDKVNQIDWKNIIGINNSYVKNFCSRVIKEGRDMVIVSSIRDKKEFPKEMEAIKILRQEGIAEFD